MNRPTKPNVNREKKNNIPTTKIGPGLDGNIANNVKKISFKKPTSVIMPNNCAPNRAVGPCDVKIIENINNQNKDVKIVSRKRKIDQDKISSTSNATTSYNQNNNSSVGPTDIKRNKLDKFKPSNKLVKNDYEKYSCTKDNTKTTKKPVKNDYEKSSKSTKDKLKLVENTKMNNISTTSSNVLNNKSSSCRRQHNNNNSILSKSSTKIKKHTVSSSTTENSTSPRHASDGENQKK